MKSIDVVKDLIAKSPNLSQNKIGIHLGMTSQAMSNRMMRDDLKVGFFAEVLDVLGYDLVAVPKGSRLPKGSVKVDSK